MQMGRGERGLGKKEMRRKNEGRTLKGRNKPLLPPIHQDKKPPRPKHRGKDMRLGERPTRQAEGRFIKPNLIGGGVGRSHESLHAED